MYMQVSPRDFFEECRLKSRFESLVLQKLSISEDAGVDLGFSHVIRAALVLGPNNLCNPKIAPR